MKKFSYLVLAVSILLLTACPGEVIDPDDPKDPKEALLKQKIEALVSPDLMKAIKGMGMPIHDGTNPPNIEGKYLADDQTMKKTNLEEDDPPGTKYEDEVLTISGQNNDNFTVTLKSETASYSQTFSMVISGNGDRFTLYAPIDIPIDDNTRVKAVLLYSGKIKEGELHDLYSGTFISDKAYFGLGQVFYEADGVAKKTDGNTSEVIEATGETATGSYKGKDMVMKFRSNLQISIKAAKNQDAPHEEITITEREEMEMFNLGKHIILDFSKMRSAYTIDVETVVDKGLNAEEDIDCSLFTTDRQAVEAAKGRIYKKVDFSYNKTTGKLTLSLQANAPFNPTRSGTTPESGKYGYLAISLTPDYNFETETVTMKAPYMEQAGSTCWAACAVMFVRSYKDLPADQDNSLFRLVKEIGHSTLDEGWNTNFITFSSYDTGSIVKAIQERIGGGITISSSSFRRTKSAATEMVKLLRKKHPVILNHGTHVLYVIGYRKGENASTTSFLVHDPQGMTGDMYKWIVWDQYLKQVNFNEAWFRGDAIYILYADKPMLDNPVLQTMAIPAADTQNKMSPDGTNLTFTMQAYGKGRKVFPKYDQKEFTGIGWGKLGYDAENTKNDTLYSPTKLNVEMKVYNADDKATSMLLSMDLGGGAFKHYSAEFTCPAKGFYTVKGSDFKDTSAKQFDPSLVDFFKVPGDKNLRLEFALKNVWGKGNIEEFDYHGLVVKTVKSISLTTAKAVGETIELSIATSVHNDTWIDLNNNGQRDEGENIRDGKPYTLGAQTIRIYGPVTALTCQNNQLTSLDASSCNTLKRLHCQNNLLTSSTLNVSGCTALEGLHCSDNQLTSLNVSGYTALDYLNCANNQLTSLNVSGCTALSHFFCNDNQLSSLNVSGLISLRHFSFYNNPLVSLDASGCTGLATVRYSQGKLTSLNVSGCTALKWLYCDRNQLASLNVSGCTALQELDCSNNLLTSLNVNEFTALKKLYCDNNNMCEVRPAIFDSITYLSYDIRYRYQWDSKQQKYVVKEDRGKGYWYAHEPEGGCHRPNPCNN
ncbi:MAG TPA: hypothetical protein GXZ56_03840 [Bacteroidales bacterium]|jgi:hypothetical protein|nr:hypothetical protein [Bacteroidales bacterium]